MTFDAGLLDWVTEALEPVGTVAIRRMMGGAVLYLDGATFALLMDGGLWFKADAESDPVWDRENCPKFAYQARDRVIVMNYRRAPDEVQDDAEAMRRWALLAVEAGRRTPGKKKAKQKR